MTWETQVLLLGYPKRTYNFPPAVKLKKILDTYVLVCYKFYYLLRQAFVIFSYFLSKGRYPKLDILGFWSKLISYHTIGAEYRIFLFMIRDVTSSTNLVSPIKFMIQYSLPSIINNMFFILMFIFIYTTRWYIILNEDHC